MKIKLAIVTSHPIQYHAPVFHMLSEKENISVKVFYTWGNESLKKYDPGFGKQIEWDIPLLEGYEYEFLKNTSKDPGTHHFAGIKNPDSIKAIRKFAPDALLIYGWFNQSHLRILRYFKSKTPIYFRGDSNNIGRAFGLKDLMRNLFLRWIYRHIDFAFFVGTANKEYYLKAGLKKEQLIFAPHAIDNNRFSASPTNRAQNLRSSLGISENDILVLYAGKMEAVKNLSLLIRAFCSIHRANDHLLLVGNGHLEQDLKKISAGNPNIHFMDFQNQSFLPVIYQAADLFCLPSLSETWGLAINEAMAAGKAVLVSNHAGCASDLVKPTINGDIFESGNQNDLAGKLRYLVYDKHKLRKMGERSREIIQIWSFEAQVNAISKAVSSIKGKQ